jgi:hypothetical protein
MADTKKQDRAIKALNKAREKRYKLRAIWLATGVSVGHLSAIGKGVPFTDECADKILAGCKSLGRKP